MPADYIMLSIFLFPGNDQINEGLCWVNWFLNLVIKSEWVSDIKLLKSWINIFAQNTPVGCVPEELQIAQLFYPGCFLLLAITKVLVWQSATLTCSIHCCNYHSNQSLSLCLQINNNLWHISGWNLNIAAFSIFQ